MELWSNFYLLIGTAAATLIGLMFIAITFGSKLIGQHTLVAARSILSPIIYHFTHAFILSCVALIPREGAFILSVVSLALGILRLVTLPGLAKQLSLTKKEGHEIELSDWVYGIVIPC